MSVEITGTQPEFEVQKLYVQIKESVVDEIIEHGLSKTESKLFFYLLKLDRFGDKSAKVKVAEILLATGIGKTAYHAAMSKFEIMGWFDFKHSEVEVTNLCTPSKKSAKSNSEFGKSDSRFGNANQKFGKTNSERLSTTINIETELLTRLDALVTQGEGTRSDIINRLLRGYLDPRNSD